MAAILLDIDGVLHVSGEPIAGAAAAVARLRNAGHRLRFVTNNTVRARAQLAEELRGLGFELRDDKEPHWTGSRNSPRTFGHFGGSGTFLWVDPDERLACACLTDREFDEWALAAWPELSDAVLDERSAA